MLARHYGFTEEELDFIINYDIKYRMRECESEASQIVDVIRTIELLRLNAGILFLHLILTASFMVIPVILRDQIRLASIHQLLLFFTAFNYLEASLPALVSRVAPADRRGTALGVYSMSQFLGTFFGGALGGGLYGRFGAPGVFLFCIAVVAVWLPLAWQISRPRNLSSHMIKVGKLSRAEAVQLTAKLTAIAGVAEAVVVFEEGIAYLKVDPEALDREALREISPSRE